MLQEERKQYILSLLNAKSSVTVAELSKAFQLSEVSVRKMLMKMEKQGEIKKDVGRSCQCRRIFTGIFPFRKGS